VGHRKYDRQLFNTGPRKSRASDEQDHIGDGLRLKVSCTSFQSQSPVSETNVGRNGKTTNTNGHEGNGFNNREGGKGPGESNPCTKSKFETKSECILNTYRYNLICTSR